MTVCIAAICESGNKIVVATDRMFTAPSPINLEFETEEQKIEQMAPRCVALMSGSTGVGTEVLDGARRTLGGRQSPTIADVSEIVRGAYTSVRGKKAYETIVVPALGSDFSVFIEKGVSLPAYLQPQPQVYQQMVAVAQNFNLHLELVIAGIDPSGAHISRITHPGTLVWFDKLGYDAIGTGGIHALTRLSLGAQTTRRALVDTLYSVYDAKKAAEVAPGVGRATDIAIVEDGGLVWQCPQPVCDTLEELHAEASKRLSPDLDQLRKVYDEHRHKS